MQPLVASGSEEFVSRLLQQNIHLSEVGLILRLLPSFLDFLVAMLPLTATKAD